MNGRPTGVTRCLRACAVALAGALAAVLTLTAIPATAATSRTLYVKSGAAPGGDGSAAHPFDSLAAVSAASARGDTILVEPSTGPALDGGIKLKPGQRLLGGGPQVASLASDAPRPLVTNTSSTANTGDAVVLANRTTVSNLVITGTYRGGIYGRNVRGVDVTGNDLSATNSSCTTGFVVQRFVLPTGYAGVGAPLSLPNGWASIMVDESAGRRAISISGNTVHDSTCADGIDVRTSGTARVRAAVRHNAVTRIQEDPRMNSVIAIGMQTVDHAVLHAVLTGNRETRIGNELAGDMGIADSEGVFANSAGPSRLVERVTHNRFAHGLGHLSANCIEAIASNGGPQIAVHVNHSTCRDAVGDLIEAVNLSRRATMKMTLDHVTASHSTWPLAKVQSTAVVPGDDGDCLLVAGTGAHNSTSVKVRHSTLTDCAADTVGVASNVVDGSGPVRSLRLDVSDSSLTRGQLANLYVKTITPVRGLRIRVQRTDLAASGGSVVELDREDSVKGAIDLGGGRLGSVGANCIFGGTDYDVDTTGFDLTAKHDWWGAPGAPRADRIRASDATVRAGRALHTPACGPGAPASYARAGHPGARGRLSTHSYTQDGLTYPYLDYRPASVDSSRRTPLVVVVHGCQTTAAQQMRATRYNRVAQRYGFEVIYPDLDSTGALEPGPIVNCWRFYDPANWHRGVGDAAAIAGMTTDTIDRSHVDSRRVYLIGMSSGAAMAAILARAYPDLYAAVGIHSGGPYADPGCMASPDLEPQEATTQLAFAEMGERARVVPIIDINGALDTTASPGCSSKTIDQAIRVDNLVLSGSQDGPLGFKPSSVRHARVPGGHRYSVQTWTDQAGRTIAQRWLVNGMTHAWSGGTSNHRYARFTDPRGPNAALASWRFFAHVRLG